MSLLVLMLYVADGGSDLLYFIVNNITVTSSVLTTNDCQSLFDMTNFIKTNDISSLCKDSKNRKRGRLLLLLPEKCSFKSLKINAQH